MFDYSRAEAKPASGVYSWSIATDRVHSDSAAAEAFGFTAEEGAAGLPIGRYLERIHPEDLPRVAKSIRDAMISGLPFNEDYRIRQPNRACVTVMAVGSCFRDAAGEPSHYAGLIFPAAAPEPVENALLQQCLVAYDIARRQQKSGVAEKLIEAMGELETADEEEFGTVHVLRRH